MASKTDDAVIAKMAEELHSALFLSGLDPLDPPTDIKPPSGKAWGEYVKRGGDVKMFDSPDDFMVALIGKVREIEHKRLGAIA